MFLAVNMEDVPLTVSVLLQVLMLLFVYCYYMRREHQRKLEEAQRENQRQLETESIQRKFEETHREFQQQLDDMRQEQLEEKLQRRFERAMLLEERRQRQLEQMQREYQRRPETEKKPEQGKKPETWSDRSGLFTSVLGVLLTGRPSVAAGAAFGAVLGAAASILLKIPKAGLR